MTQRQWKQMMFPSFCTAVRMIGQSILKLWKMFRPNCLTGRNLPKSILNLTTQASMYGLSTLEVVHVDNMVKKMFAQTWIIAATICQEICSQISMTTSNLEESPFQSTSGWTNGSILTPKSWTQRTTWVREKNLYFKNMGISTFPRTAEMTLLCAIFTFTIMDVFQTTGRKEKCGQTILIWTSTQRQMT
jgi:hypothetical protein